MRRFIPEETELKPLTDYEGYVTRIRAFGVELKEDILNNIPPSEALGRYNQKVEDLEGEFTEERLDDYYNVRVVEQQQVIEVEKDSVGMGEPRTTSTNGGDFKAPDDMIYDTHDFNERSSQGDCHSYF